MFANVVALVIVGGLLFLFMLLLLGASMASGNKTHNIPRKSVLVVNLGLRITDKPGTEDFSTVVNQLSGGMDQTLSLRQYIRSIEKAADDKRIKGLFITGNANSSGWASLKEVRDALVKFKESGKPIIAYGSYFNEANYYVATVADKLYINPAGAVEFNGFASQIMFLKGAFDKYGVDVQVTRVGKYKSAVEPYLQEGMSDANREQLEGLLNDMFDIFLTSVSETRGLEVEQLRLMADQYGMLDAQAARTAGLVDDTLYTDEVLDELRLLTGTTDKGSFKDQIDLGAYAESMGLEPARGSRNRVAVIYAEGNIIDGNSRDQVGGDTIARMLRKARTDDTVKAVVLRINSPGGSASASEVILRETRLLKKEKPFVVSMGTFAASGGYWIASYADQIYAEPNTVTGSIGVFGMFMNFQKVMNDNGINVDVAKTSVMADALTPFRPNTDEELALVQKLVDRIYEDFLDRVSEGRGMDRDKVHEIAQGRVWSGVSAQKLGLVDELGGINDAVAAAAEKAGLTEGYRWYQYQRSKTFAEELVEIMEGSPESIKMPAPFNQITGQLGQTIEKLGMYNNPMGVYAVMPFDLEIR